MINHLFLSTILIPVMTLFFVAVLFIIPHENVKGQEIIDDGLDISNVSVGTYVRNSPGDGIVKGTHFYVDAMVTNDEHRLRLPLRAEITYPDGSSETITETFREDDLTRVWSTERLGGYMP